VSDTRFQTAGRRATRVDKRAGRTTAAVSVGGLYAALDALSPFRLAAEWDNVGLLAGRPEWTVQLALLAIDLTDAVAREVLQRRADAVVLYHPPIFKGIRAITPLADGPTTMLPDLLAARVSILAVHTALDAAVGGTNDVLLDALAPVERYPLQPHLAQGQQYKLVVFVPPYEVDRLRHALAAAGAGVIGHYAECSFELAGRGTFRGDQTTQPTAGQKLVLEHADEVRVEMVVPKARLGEVVRALYARHSYEEPAFDLYPLHKLPERAAVGLGRVGVLKRPQRGETLVRQLAGHVDLAGAQVVGDLRRAFRSVTAAAGAFGGQAFRDPDSLVLTGELKHHAALELLRRGITAVCLGHYASERPVLDALRAQLAARVPGARLEVARSDRAPFSPLSP